jgi:uncharacterized protein YbaR (Trm112 family)
MVSIQLLEMLRCPHCVNSSEGRLSLKKDYWLVCQERNCRRKYPIRAGIPVMLADEGERWIESQVEDLPIPPPGR